MDNMARRKPSPEIQKTIDLTTGIVGLSVADSVAGTMPAGLPRTIIRGGALPIAATGLLGVAGRTRKTKRRRK